MGMQPQNPNQWAVDLYKQYQGAAGQDRTGLIQQMQGQDQGAAFNQAMKGAGYKLSQSGANPEMFKYMAPAPPAPAPSGGTGKPGTPEQSPYSQLLQAMADRGPQGGYGYSPYFKPMMQPMYGGFGYRPPQSK